MSVNENTHSRESIVIRNFADRQVRDYLSSSAAVEEAVEFDSQGEKVRGRFYLPSAEACPVPAVLVAHGYTGSRNADSRLLVWIARALAHNGIAALAIDFRGSGESEGDFQQMTPVTEVADAWAALDLLTADERIDSARLGMVGHSLGGLVTTCTSAEDERLQAVALWAAVADKEVFSPRFDKTADNRVSGGWDVGGLIMGDNFAKCCEEIDVPSLVGRGKCPMLIAHGTEDQTVRINHARLYEQFAKDSDREQEVYIIDGADHCFNNVKHRISLISMTLNWFQKCFMGDTRG